MNDYDPYEMPSWLKKMLDGVPTLPPPPPPAPEIAYFVGGPADGREMPVHAGMVEYIVPSVSSAAWALTDPMEPRSTVEAHRYSPCPETGEWLWRGVR